MKNERIKKSKVGRPTVALKRKRFNIALNPDLRKAAEGVAFRKNQSFSRYVENLIRADVETAKA